MQPVVSSEQMRWCDETTISRAGIPGLLLMDRAGTTAAHRILLAFPPSSRTVVPILCGKGNNAGDGFVIGRTLAEHGYEVHVVLTAPRSALTGDAATQFGILRRVAALPDSNITILSFSAFKRSVPGHPALVVDAVFGTGFRGVPRGIPRAAIGWMRNIKAPVVSVDVPSGIDASTGTADGMHVSADMTITFGLLKSGLLLNEGREHSGHVICVDIGIPSGIVRKVRKAGHLIGQADVRALLPKRPKKLHKYTAGKVLMVAGSKGYTGAAHLASQAALRSGAGAVVLMVPESIYPIMARKHTDEVVHAVPATPGGTFGDDSVREVVRKLAWADVLCIGPGLALNDATTRFLEAVLTRRTGPAVIDADALSIVARSRILRPLVRSRDWILTPHAGEFDRFVSIGSGEIERTRIESIRRFAKRKKSTVLLKGAPSITATGAGECFINSTGNPGMATIGSGDVLSGCIAALRSQGLGSAEATYAGAYLHGRAGDLAGDVLGERSVVASDLLQFLPVALRECSQ